MSKLDAIDLLPLAEANGHAHLGRKCQSLEAERTGDGLRVRLQLQPGKRLAARDRGDALSLAKAVLKPPTR